MCEFETIIGLLDEESATTLNAVQLIANIAENPKGQALSEKYIDKLDKITNI